MTLDFYGVWCLGFMTIRCKLIKPNCFLACRAITLCLEWTLLAANVSASGTCLGLTKPISDAPFTADCILKPCRGKGLIFLSSFGWGFNICEEGAERVTGKLLRASSQRKTLPLKCGRRRYKVCMLSRTDGGKQPFLCLNSQTNYLFSNAVTFSS